MVPKNILRCEKCKCQIKKLDVNDFGELIDWGTRWEQYLCTVCHEEIWNNILAGACGVCETEPCKKGRDCWVNPWPRIMYLCYVAPRREVWDETLLANH